jgi:protein-disulfide isomerase
MNEIQDQPLTAPQEKKQQPWVWVAVGCGCLVLLVLAVLSGGVVYYMMLQSTPTSVSPVTLADGSQSNVMGDANAPVMIIEYGDYQCPYCYRFWKETEGRIVETYVKTGKVYFIYRSAGNFIGPESGAAAEAAYCAGDQGKFWEYHDMLYSNQGGENTGAFSESNLLKFANKLELNQNMFRDCLRSGKYTARVAQEAAEMQSDGVRATPSFLINGQLVEGAQPFDVFQQTIEAILQGN